MTRTLTAVAVATAAMAAALALTSVATAQAPTPPKAPTLSPALETCIRTNADIVERGVESLTEGVGFLVEKVCAAQTRDAIIEEQRQQFEQGLAAQRKYLEDECKAQRSRPATRTPEETPALDFCAELEALKAQMGPDGEAPAFDPGVMGVLVPGLAPPPEAISLAARLLVEKRAARTRR